jgi:glycosyltransferase involved in cell wall biosynthesis
MSISVLILTLDEEVNLGDCLDSVAWCDDVVVFDSFSSDRTVEIARKNGARVVQRTFDNYASQRNSALTEVAYRHPWVLMLDADERMTPELYLEINSTLERTDDRITLYRFRRKDQLFGQWLKRASGYPSWFGRLVRPSRVEIRREINEEYHTNGGIGFLQEHILHYPLNKGIAHWYERHNRYSSLEAMALIQETQGSLPWRDLLARDPIIRRRALKQMAYRMPARPLCVFIYLYLVRLGFLDGKAGLIYSALRSYYELMIDLKIMEIRRRQQGLSI